MGGIIAKVAKENGVSEEQCRADMQEALDHSWETNLKHSGKFKKKPSVEEFMVFLTQEAIYDDVKAQVEKDRQIEFWTRNN